MTKFKAISGPTDSFTDVDGIQVGMAENAAANTGVTAIVPKEAVAMGVDVRGGGPGTRETEALDPSCLVEKVHGLVLSGGSVFGLAAADGVAAELSAKGIGLDISPVTVPVVPAAILFDLRNGGDKNWGATPPYAELGRQAAQNLSTTVPVGRAGAGYGATCGGENGGLGTASLCLPDGSVVAAIVAVNSFGISVDRHGAEHGTVNLPKLGFAGTNTTIGAVATNVSLDKAGCKRLAMMAQDGYARALRPIHTPFDGDTVFAMSTGAHEPAGDAGVMMSVLGTLAADCMVRAIEKAITAANS